MIVITGAAGFIGSNLASELIKYGYNDLVLVDDFSKIEKKANFSQLSVTALVDRNEFFVWLDSNHKMVEFVFHIGARTNTAEFDAEILKNLNTDYTKIIWRKCCEYGLPLVYASSAATYGSGENGFSDSIDPEILAPLNPYGVSKNEFDKWAIKQEKKPYFWAGLKFFNVYGPNEYHKARMSSVIFHAYNQISDTGKLKLFRSHKPEYADGCQLRDFIYVKDVCSVMIFFMEKRKNSGIYNLGTGKSRTFKDLALATFEAINIPSDIQFIDTPEDIRDKYQYYTQADMNKLKSVGYDKLFYSLEQGISDYVRNYLIKGKYN